MTDAPTNLAGIQVSAASVPMDGDLHLIFISHVEEDARVAIEIAEALEQAGFTTWYYERDCLPGPQYLLQVPAAIDASTIMVVIISPHSLSSNQVTSEVVRAYEAGKSFMPLLLGISHAEFQQRQPVWRQALGASTSLPLPKQGLAAAFPRIIAGARALLAGSVHASGSGTPLPQVQRPETTEERFAQFFAERPDVVSEIEASASCVPAQTVAEFERLLVRLEVQVCQPWWPPSCKSTEDQAGRDRLLTLIDRHDPDLEEAKVYVAVSRKIGASYEEWHEGLQLYQRAIGEHGRIRSSIAVFGAAVIPLVCLSFREFNSSDAFNSTWHFREWRMDIELANVMSKLRDFRALPFLADALLRHANDVNGHNSWALGMIGAVRAFGVSLRTVDACFERVVGVTASEVLREQRERDRH